MAFRFLWEYSRPERSGRSKSHRPGRHLSLEALWPADYGGQNSAIIELIIEFLPVRSISMHQYLAEAILFSMALSASRAHPEHRMVIRSFPSGTITRSQFQRTIIIIKRSYRESRFYISGSRQETDRRIDQPVDNLFHDHGQDYFLYGKFDYILSDIDYLTANLNYEGLTLRSVRFYRTNSLRYSSDNKCISDHFVFPNYQFGAKRRVESICRGYAREGGLIHTPVPSILRTSNLLAIRSQLHDCRRSQFHDNRYQINI